jgi:thioredoxin 2
MPTLLKARHHRGPLTSHDSRGQTLTCPSTAEAGCHTALPWLTSAGDGDFDQVVTASTLPVLLDLWAPWCGPCRVVAPGVERAARELAGRLKAVKVNVDEAPRVAERLGVQGIPTLLILRQGREVARQVGAVPPAALLRWAEEAITEQAA